MNLGTLRQGMNKMMLRVATTALNQVEKRHGSGFQEIGDVSAFLQHLLDESRADSAGVRVTDADTLTLSYAFACMKVLSETAGHIPLRLMQRSGLSAVRVEQHDLIDLMSQPSAQYTNYNFRTALEGHRSGWGNAYAWIQRPSISSTEIESLQILKPNVTIPRWLTLRDGTTVLIYETTINNKKVRIMPADMIHVPGFGFDGIQGYSMARLHREMFGHGLAMQKFGNAFFAQGAKPGIIFKTSVNTSNQEAFQQEIEEKFNGPQNWGSTMVLPKGVEFEQVTIDPKDAEFLSSRKFNRTETCGIYRVPPHLIADLENATFTNAVEMDLSFVKHTMVPIFTNYEQEFDRKTLTEAERRAGLFWRYDVKGVLRGAPEVRSKYWESAIKNGYARPLDAAISEDLPADNPLLDVYYMPINSVPAGTELTNMRPMESKSLSPLVNELSRRITKATKNEFTKIKDDGSVEEVRQRSNKMQRFVCGIVAPLFASLEIGAQADSFATRYIDQLFEHVGDSYADALPFITWSHSS